MSDIAGWIPYILSIVFMLVGLIIIVRDLIVHSSWWHKQKVEIEERDQEFSEQNKIT